MSKRSPRKGRGKHFAGKSQKVSMTTAQYKQHLLIEQSRAKYLMRTAPTTWVADGKCLDMLQNNINPRDMFALDLVNLLAEKPLPWRVWLGVFQIDNWGKPFVTSLVVPPETLPEKAVSNSIGDHVDGQLEALVEGCNQKHVISWGWLAIPNPDADLDEMEPGIIEQFTAWKAFDREHCEATHAARVESERLYQEESAA